jgi:hypothetical protein
MAEFNQQFDSFQEWVNKGTSWLTRHPLYSREDWRHFTAICYDTKGHRVTCGGDFQSASDEGAFPVRWIWPDQVADLCAALDAKLDDASKLLFGLSDVLGSKGLIDLADECRLQGKEIDKLLAKARGEAS